MSEQDTTERAALAIVNLIRAEPPPCRFHSRRAPDMPRANRSSEEFEMRRALAEWGRVRWPEARLVHELVVWQTRRIDMAWILPDTIIGAEIKSSRDTLDRLDAQLQSFTRCLPLTVLALAPKWADREHRYRQRGVNVCVVSPGADAPVTGHMHNAPERAVTVQMLDLLWAEELRGVARRLTINLPKQATRLQSIAEIAQLATGREIVREVCHELRARDAFPKSPDHPPSDPPLGRDDASPVFAKSQGGLL